MKLAASESLIDRRKINILTKLTNHRNIPYLVFLVIPLIVFIIGMIIPLMMGVYDSFTNWNGTSPTQKFIGLANYAHVFQDSEFRSALWFTVLFMIFNTIIQNVGALLIAMILDSKIKLKRFYRTIVFAPVLLSPILVGQIWSQMYGTILPKFNQIFGTNINFNLFASPHTVLGGLLIANNWQWIGYWMLIYLAGLQAVPKELYEACTVDGGGGWRKFFNITIPMLAPSITICTIGIATGSLKVFELIITATGGGPGFSSQSLILYIYNADLGRQQAGYASAMSVIFLILLIIFALVQLKFFRKREVQL